MVALPIPFGYQKEQTRSERDFAREKVIVGCFLRDNAVAVATPNTRLLRRHESQQTDGQVFCRERRKRQSGAKEQERACCQLVDAHDVGGVSCEM